MMNNILKLVILILAFSTKVFAENNVLPEYINDDQNLIFENVKTKEISPTYLAGSYLYSPIAPLMLTANDPNNTIYYFTTYFYVSI